ncbi:MAG: cytochrome b [Burkholderiaceae bacterium]
MRDASPSYDRVAITLHWVIAVGVLAQLAFGWWMIDIPKQPTGLRAYWFNFHKSTGLLLGGLIALRILWRLTHRPPTLPASVPSWQARAAHISHFLLYACMVTMPLAGFLGSTYSGYPIRFFGFTIADWGWKDESLKNFFSVVHYSTAWLFMTLIGLHAAAALKHRLIDRDGVFERMVPRRSSPADARVTSHHGA